MEYEEFYGQYDAESEADIQNQPNKNSVVYVKDNDPSIKLDPLLFALSQTVSQLDIEVDVTFLVEGKVVSGQLISIDRYFSDIHASLSLGIIYNTDLDEVHKSIDAIASAFHAWKQYTDENPNDSFAYYVHLKNAVVHQASKEGDLQIPLFRVALRSISGFNVLRPHPGLPIL